MTPKEYLEQIYDLDQEIKSLQDEHEKASIVNLSASKIKQIVSDAGLVSNPTEDIVMKRHDYSVDILNKAHELIKLKVKISGEIDQILDRKLRVCLRERYVNSKKWREVADIFDVDIRHVHRIHAEALDEFETFFPEIFK